MFVATSAYLSAVLLIGDARAGEDDLERYFTRRAAGVVGAGSPPPAG